MDFSGVGLKIERAQRHTADLNRAMDAELNAERYIVGPERDSQTGHYVYSIPKLPLLDPEWPVVVGEILFDLRSALDHFAWQLVRLDGGKPGEQTQFPIRDTPFDKNAKLIGVDLTPQLKDPKLLAALDKAQPYYGIGGSGALIDQHPLQRLKLMNNWDKHRLLLLFFQVLDLDRVYWGGSESEPKPVGWWFSREPLKDGSPVARFDFGTAELPPGFYPNLTLQVAIEEPLTSDGSRTRLTPLSALLKELDWGVVQYVLADKFAHLLATSTLPEMFPNMRRSIA